MHINKRYKDIFEQYIYRGEPTPISVGTLCICALCFLVLLIATFTQFNFYHPTFIRGEEPVKITYTPQIPVMIFIIYILGKPFSIFMLSIYILVGFFVWPVFVLGGGLDYVQNYLFGYLLGLFSAIFCVSYILKKGMTIKYRLLSGIAGVASVHVCGLIYCFILAVFHVIQYNSVIPIITVITGNKIVYDICFAAIAMTVAPWCKNVLWICMKPKPDLKDKLKYARKRN